MRSHKTAIAVGVWALMVSSCSGPTSTPERQIRDTIRAGEEAAERRDLSALADLVAKGYHDDNGYDRRTLLRLVQAYLIGHQSIHLLVRPQAIGFTTPDRAKAEILVAMTGEPLESADQLINIRADLFKFEILFVKTGAEQWQATSANWHRAGIDDFF